MRRILQIAPGPSPKAPRVGSGGWSRPRRRVYSPAPGEQWHERSERPAHSAASGSGGRAHPPDACRHRRGVALPPPGRRRRILAALPRSAGRALRRDLPRSPRLRRVRPAGVDRRHGGPRLLLPGPAGGARPGFGARGGGVPRRMARRRVGRAPAREGAQPGDGGPHRPGPARAPRRGHVRHEPRRTPRRAVPGPGARPAVHLPRARPGHADAGLQGEDELRPPGLEPVLLQPEAPPPAAPRHRADAGPVGQR